MLKIYISNSYHDAHAHDDDCAVAVTHDTYCWTIHQNLDHLKHVFDRHHQQRGHHHDPDDLTSHHGLMNRLGLAVLDHWAGVALVLLAVVACW